MKTKRTQITYSKEVYDDWIEYYKTCKNVAEVSRKFGAPAETIRSVLLRNNQIEKYSVDHCYFDEIDCEEKAYWLGYIFGDGCISSNSNTITISSQDIDHLNKFKIAIKSNHKLCENFAFASPQMHQALQRWGVKPRKQFIEDQHIPKLSDDLLLHYVRGILDSDGWIGKGGSFGISSCSNTFLSEIQTFFYDRYGIKTKLNISINHWGRVWVLDFYSSNFNQLSDLLYINANIYLDRKYDRAIQFRRKTPAYIWTRKLAKGRLQYIFGKGKFHKKFDSMDEAVIFRDHFLKNN